MATKMALIILLVFFGSYLCNGNAQTPQTSPIRIQASVLAYSPFSRLTILAGPPLAVDSPKHFHEDLLVRVEQQSDGLKIGQLVRLKYADDTGAKPELPKRLFTQKGDWIFEATRDVTCTRNLETVLYYKVDGKMYPNMQFTSWAKPLRLSNATIVPCYVITSGGFAQR